MTVFVLVFHLLLAIALIVVVLLQRSEGGALGIGGGGGGFMTGRGAANFLTRTTAILAACFIGTSILLAILSGAHRQPTSILDRPATEQAPAAPAGPSVPLSQ